MNTFQRRFALVLAVAAAFAGVGSRAAGQQDTIPSRAYFAAFGDFVEGDFYRALKNFQSVERGAIRGANGRWIDSIPYQAMVGECYYHIGDHARALAVFRVTLRQFLQHHNFMLRVQWPRTIRTASRPLPRITWGPVKRTARRCQWPDTMQMTLGNIMQLPNAPAIGNLRTIPIDVTEIVRTLNLAIRRYGTLLGPTARQDLLLSEVIAKLQARPTLGQHWSQAWIDVLLGTAYSAAHKTGDATPLLKRGLVAAGQFEHPLTAPALLELGHMALNSGDFGNAGELFEKATYAAVEYRRDMNMPFVVEEAFHYGFIAHLLTNKKKPFTLAEPASLWARKEKSLHLQTSLLLSAAESALSLGLTREAANFVTAARSVARRREMIRCKMGARLHHVEAMLAYQQGNVVAGDAALGEALAFQSKGSMWLFHIALADDLHLNRPRSFTDRDASELFKLVLREPARYDWRVHPLESLSVLTTPHVQPFEHWFELSLTARGGVPKALEIADLIRRHRFHTSLKFGGRLLSLRWLLEGPEKNLDQETARQKRDILVEFPGYAQLSGKIKQVQGPLKAMPLVLDQENDKDAAHKQKQLLAELTALSLRQEAVLRQIAVRREFSPLIFPPVKSTKELQEALSPGHALLVYLATSKNRLYSFLLTNEKDKYPAWLVRNPRGVARYAATMLREMGNFSSKRAIPIADLAETKWQAAAAQLMDELLTGKANGAAPAGKHKLPDKLEEITIVPDGLLWYVPFEALPAPGDKKGQKLINVARVRYAPTASLALPDSRGKLPEGNSAVVVGRLFPGKGEDERAKTAFLDLRNVSAGAVQLPATLPAPSAVYSTLFDRLIVLDNIQPGEKGPYSVAPVTTNRGPGGTLNDWIPLPWGGPDQVILPGFHTASENAMGGKHLAGMDLFLTSCAMMATGTRTILISRWPTGGKVSFDLVREFVQELPHTSAAQAWQRGVFVASDQLLNPDLEPRLNPDAKTAPPKANHPFFWAGYMLLDRGVSP